MSALFIDDVDNDNQWDLIYIASNQIYTLFGYGNCTFGTAISHTTGDCPFGTPIIAADVNSDGRLDLVGIIDCRSSNLGVLLGNGDGTFGELRVSMIGSMHSVSSMTVADLNNDHQLDLTVIHPLDYSVYIFLNNGDGTFGATTIISIKVFSVPETIAVADLNDDTRSDIIFVNKQGFSIGVLLGNGNGTFQALTKFSTFVYSYPDLLAIGDFNSDGSLDLAVDSSSTSYMMMLFGNGDGTFRTPILFSIRKFASSAALTTGSFNSDRLLDLLYIVKATNTIGILYNSCQCCE